MIITFLFIIFVLQKHHVLSILCKLIYLIITHPAINSFFIAPPYSVSFAAFLYFPLVQCDKQYPVPHVATTFVLGQSFTLDRSNGFALATQQESCSCTTRQGSALTNRQRVAPSELRPDKTKKDHSSSRNDPFYVPSALTYS